MEVHRYYMARANGNMQAEAPPELVEIGLMERFHWTPMEIAQIPLGKLQRIFVAMEQSEQSKMAAADVQNRKANISSKTTGKQKKGNRR